MNDLYGNPMPFGTYSPEEYEVMQQQMMQQQMVQHQMMQQQAEMQQRMMQQQAMLRQQPPYYNGMGIPVNGGYRSSGAVTKKDILAYLQGMLCPSECETVGSFDTRRTRHICNGIKEIVLLDVQSVPVPTPRGVISVEVFFCPRCRKLLINSQSLEVY